ncbi:MAG: 50S ribosomal protein L10 [Candidatus Zambryskibacteria bacterium RIFCSPHIGHO2_01_FULL_44_22b]|uniref:Large ribosomal subunit protein uL10 n=2 Tax=Candidatus Zambryskiibacteriota TaxID=1817925 RepID=A0A1G2SYA8_9BACT|nr:MAG: 50S ribosomal protein L10 [Candidatus Zambryskibacteria bacterium RIFCSPHIGHO2_01_FULL_44_22b]OHB05565.1 MAG: 50S ribosomal protein L10 [Candidatus Zambryskibacteria bacterium RIFCSPLOWO2_01_FULL_45_43]
MAITRVKKGEVIDKLKKAFKDAKSLVFVNFKGLTVGNTTLMRRALKGENISYTVAKKTLASKALDEQSFIGEKPELSGELSLAWGEDLVAPARGVYNFVKKFPENLKILGGVFEGRYMTALEMIEIAKIPGLEVLRGKFVNIINSPIQRFAVALSEIAKKKS